jgi:hypothetical protein
LVSVRNYEHGGLALTGKAVDLKSTGAHAPWGFESLALRHLIEQLRTWTRSPIPIECDGSVIDGGPGPILREALKESGRVGIGSIVLRQREHPTIPQSPAYFRPRRSPSRPQPHEAGDSPDAAYLEKGLSAAPPSGTRSGSHAGSVGAVTSAVAGWALSGSISFGSQGGGSPRRYMIVTRWTGLGRLLRPAVEVTPTRSVGLSPPASLP